MKKIMQYLKDRASQTPTIAFAMIICALVLDVVLGGLISGTAVVLKAAVVAMRATDEPRVSDYAYPDGVLVSSHNGDGNIRHIIWVSTDVSALLTAIDGTGFGNAPKGTVIFQNLAGTAKIHQKDSDGAWDSVALA